MGVALSAANTHDSMVLAALVDVIPSIRGPAGRPGRPRRRPAKLHADKADDHRRCRRALRTRGISARIARRGIDASQRLGRYRWVIERTLAWLVAQRRRQVRHERSSQLLHGLVHLACALICLRRLRAATPPPQAAAVWASAPAPSIMQEAR